MRLLVLLLVAASLAAFYYLRGEPPPAAEPVAAAAAPSPTPKPVPFVLVAKVRIIREQLLVVGRSTSRGDIDPATIKMGRAIEDIKDRLESDGLTDETAMLSAVRAAAAEAGFAPHDVDAVASAFRGGGL